MSAPSDGPGRPVIDSRQNLPQLTTTLPSPSTSQQPRNKQPGDRSPVSPPGAGPVGGGGIVSGTTHGNSPKSTRTCAKCQGPLTGQFVRALGGTYHLDCFKCRVNAVPPYKDSCPAFADMSSNLGLWRNSSLQVFSRG